MTLFWIISGVLALAIAAGLVLVLMRDQRAGAPSVSYDIQVYRDQLREIDRDAARGTIAASEAERLRTEVSRRILSAAGRGSPEDGTNAAASGATRAMAAVVVLVLVAGSFALYLRMGAPGYGDLALRDRIEMARELRENRPSQAEAEAQVPDAAPAEAPADYLELVERLRAAVAERPDDIQGHALLARAEAALGNYRDAIAAQRRLIALKGEVAGSADLADLADMLVLAAGGYVSPEAEQVLDQIMARDDGNGVARYYGGLMMAQTGRPDAAFRIWDTLLRDSRASDPWVAPMLEQIGDLALAAGVGDYQPPVPGASVAGPTAEDIENAAELSDAERADMVAGMVDRLGQRLATEGGPPEDWARLLSALGVLGETERARAIWQEGQGVFAGQPAALEILREGAERAGVAQ